MKVLDASMALSWLFPRQDPAEAALADQALDELDYEEFAVPAIWYGEVANALLRGERKGLVTLAQTTAFLAELDLAEILTETDSPRLRQPASMALARSYSLTAYDAMYLELALRKGVPLATFDSQLADATRKAGGRVFGDRP
ncbi:MAG: type II toxin-antitoxin system VapC family toxin [Terracidiphilus sp.]|jgi:predicted nucleic acid-binding protein